MMTVSAYPSFSYTVSVSLAAILVVTRAQPVQHVTYVSLIVVRQLS